jgi:superfamily II DNA/RNA helicase
MLPPTLEESVAVCETTRRPSLLLSILLEAVGIPLLYIDIPSIQKVDGTGVTSNICSEKSSMCVVFSSSVDITHRLCRLLQSFNNLSDDDNKGSTEKYLFKGRVAEMSRLMRSDERETIMRDAANGDIKILVSSDHMARGIDLPNIKLVINYDPPSYAKMYVHRVGRTARANRIGHSITLLKAGRKMLKNFCLQTNNSI